MQRVYHVSDYDDEYVGILFKQMSRVVIEGYMGHLMEKALDLATLSKYRDQETRKFRCA